MPKGVFLSLSLSHPHALSITDVSIGTALTSLGKQKSLCHCVYCTHWHEPSAAVWVPNQLEEALLRHHAANPMGVRLLVLAARQKSTLCAMLTCFNGAKPSFLFCIFLFLDSVMSQRNSGVSDFHTRYPDGSTTVLNERTFSGRSKHLLFTWQRWSMLPQVPLWNRLFLIL